MRTRTTWLALTAVTALAAGAFAQARPEQKPQQPGQMGRMSMDDMMKQCREHCQATSRSADQMLTTIREARQSNDPAETRGALETIEKPLAEMQEHMKMCLHTMDMMRMQGGMGRMMGGRTNGMMPPQKPRAAGRSEKTKTALDIALKSEPDPPKTGENTFEVTVRSPDGKPVTDAEVSVRFYMAAMPSMNMPEMRSTVTLKHVKNGVYRGTGNVMMGGRWDVTVVVARGGKEVGRRKLTIIAQ